MCGAGDYFLKEAAKNSSGEAVREKRALILFVRKPELGKVKTRLAAGIGEEAALAAYLKMLAHTRGLSLDVHAERHLFYFPEVPGQDEWPEDVFHKHVQAEGDLGEKMRSAFETVFALGHDKALIIGSDCLDLRPSHLEAAYRGLAMQDFVLGPASDGGYYLLGMHKLEPRLFEHKAWSTDTVAKDTLADIAALGKTVHLLPMLNDIDTEADYRAALLRNRMD